MMTLTDLLGNDDADWMATPGRPCATPIDAPKHIRDHADNWYPGERYELAATALCAGCPVINQCLQYAIDNNEDEGIWGGATPKQRALITRRQRRKSRRKAAA